MIILKFIIGLVFLIVGAEILVRGASNLALAFGISPLLVGLTIVAFCTSSPELAVSVQAAANAQTSLAVGNVVGSNIFNVLVILGLAALIMPLTVSEQLIKLEVPLMIVLSGGLLLVSLDNNIGRFEGFVLLTALVVYLFFLVSNAKKARQADQENIEGATPHPSQSKQLIFDAGFILSGLVLLVFGSRFLVDSAIIFAQNFGVSELLIGLTIVAAGTSLPELVTSVVAAVRGERDIAVGNVVGSNIFNLIGVLSIGAIVAPNGLEVMDAALRLDIPIMIAVAVVCLPIFFTDGLITRWEGLIFILYYVAYVTYMALNATARPSLLIYGNAMLFFVIPITFLGIFAVAFQKYRQLQK